MATARGPRSRNMIARSEETQMIPIRNAVPSRYPPVITWMLIAANCLVFVFQDSLSPSELVLFVRHSRSSPRSIPISLRPGKPTWLPAISSPSSR